MIWRRLVAALVPVDWRAAVRRDLEDEAAASGRGSLWILGQLLAVAVQLRVATLGSALAFDLRYAIRSLRFAGWFTLGATVTFALGIGLNLAVFAQVDRLLFRPLPFAAPSSLVMLEPSSGGRFYSRTPRPVVTTARATTTVFRDVGVAGRTNVYAINPSGDGPALRLTTATPDLLRLLGVAPIAGRDFSDADVAAKARVALVTEDAARRLFGVDAPVGRRVGSASGPVIIGILPRGFTSPSAFVTPSDGLILDPDRLMAGSPKDGTWPAVARLQPGVSAAQAQSAVDALVARLSRDIDRPGDLPTHIAVVPIREALFGRFGTYLWLVAGAAAIVLLIACVNLSGLLLARGRARQRQQALCLALGATGRRLAAAVFLESMIVAVAGAAVSLIVIAGVEHALIAIEPAALASYAVSVGDGRVLLLAVGLVVGASAIAAIWPALTAARVDVQRTLQGGTTSGRRTRTGAVRSLLVAQAILGTVLLVSAFLVGRSLIGLVTRDLGFEASGLFVLYPRLPAAVPTPAQLTFLARVRAILAASPAVERAGAIDGFTIGLNGFMRPFPAPDRIDEGGLYQVTGDFFEALETPVLAGRPITDRDVADRADVIVLSRRGVQVLWPDASPTAAIGRAVRVPNEPDRVVVGVVADQRATSLTRPIAAAFVPYTGLAANLGEHNGIADVAVRLRRGASLDVPGIRAVIRHEFPEATLSGYESDAFLAPPLQQPKFQALLFGLFAFAATALAAIGLYAIASMDVSLRRHEVGVRLALGALPWQIWKTMVASALTPVAVGVVVGMMISWWSSTLMQSLLVDVPAHDALTLTAAPLTLIFAGMAAVLPPTRRAARTDALVVLRQP